MYAHLCHINQRKNKNKQKKLSPILKSTIKIYVSDMIQARKFSTGRRTKTMTSMVFSPHHT